MERLRPLGERRQFNLTFHNEIERPQNLVRCGSEVRPIRSLRCQPDDPVLRQFPWTIRHADFLIDNDGYVIPDRSSGNFCSQYTISNLKDQSAV